MTNRIQLKRTANVSSVPLVSDLEFGELALNYADGTVYFKNNANVVTTLVNAYEVDVVGNVTTAAQVVATGNIVGGNIATEGELKTNGTFLIGTQRFFAQGSDGFSVNENFNAGNATVTAYHYTSGAGRDAVVFDTAVTGRFTTGFGATGSAAQNKFVSFAEFNNTTWEWRRGVGIGAPNLNGGTLLANINPDGNFYTLGTITGTGNVTTDSQIITNVVANNNGNSITIIGDLLPSANEAYSLGSESLRWKEMHLSGNTIYIGGLSISALAGAIQVGNFQTNSFQVNSVPINADAGSGTITVNNQELITPVTLQQTPYVQLAEAQNRHQVYKIANRDTTNYSLMEINTIEEVGDFYLSTNIIASNAAIYLEQFQAIYEFYPNSNSTVLLTNVFSGLTVIDNSDDIVYKWDDTTTDWQVQSGLSINGNAVMTNVEITSNATILDTLTANIISGSNIQVLSNVTIEGNVTANNIVTEEEIDRRTLWLTFLNAWSTNPNQNRLGDPELIDSNGSGTINSIVYTGEVYAYYTASNINIQPQGEYYRLVPNNYTTFGDSFWSNYSGNTVANLLATRA